jgi:glycosyltransferase involved in cell wall biosynthesis
MRINTLCPDHISNTGGPSYACQAILDAMNQAGFDAPLYCISSENNVHRPFHRLSIPLWAKPLGYRLFSDDFLKKYTQWRYLRSFKNQDIAYLWPGTSLDTYRALKSAGHFLVTENVNTHQATGKRIMDAEYRRLGLIPSHGIDDNCIADECSKLELVDYVFSPGSEVTRSLLNAGVPNEKIIPTSYGFEESSILLPGEVSERASRTELTAIFVGRIGIRKGVHLLLDYWVKAGVKGKLKLVGRIDHDARQLIEPYLQRHDIEHVPYTDDLRSVYLTADIILLPSLEEGSPLVTYLALGAGLPSIMSPMGAGGVINDGYEGLVVDPHDANAWIESLRKVFTDSSLRQRLAASAYNKADEYLWRNVGRLRAESLLARLASKENIAG